MIERSSTGLRNPARVLYDEIWDGQASWTDAVFWFLVGAFCVGAIWLATVIQQ